MNGSEKRDKKKVKMVKNMLIKAAKEQYGDITPCLHETTFKHGFTEQDGTIFFWFNTPDESTHITHMKIISKD
ncbi:MAG: hypothetical protein KC517_09355 [Bacteroidetes bacterium]|nr:hypothetical protein [Bacteroidota bacterium]